MERLKRSRARAFLLVSGVVAAASALASQAASGCIFDWADDCARDHDYPGCNGMVAPGTSSSTGSSSTGSSTGSAMSSSSTTSSGGIGGGPGCSASTCSVPAMACYPYGTAACDAGTCDVTYAPTQAYGNCRTNTCGSDGDLSWVADAGNVFNGGNPCITYPCTDAGTSTTVTAAAGTACTLPSNGSGFCEPSPDPNKFNAVACLQCDPTNPATCTGGLVCSFGKCVPQTCTNGGLDPGETSIDCGGQFCLPCGPGKKCLVYSDCFSQICTPSTLTCAVPNCMDVTQNGTETDRDCGSAACPSCGPGLMCATPADCDSGVCLPTSAGMPDKCAAPTCLDGVQNGGETGVDCGGSCSPCGPDGG
jgi:hypothetical protein